MPSKANLLRGALTIAVLGIIKEKPRHGYQIIKLLKEKYADLQAPPATIYPRLRSMEKKKLIKGVKKSVGKDRVIRVFHITEQGEQELRLEYLEWGRIASTLKRLMKMIE